MDLDTFLGLQWLKGETDNTLLKDTREKIGFQWGLGSGWYSSENNLASLFNFLSEPEPQYNQEGSPAGGNRPELLDELDTMPDDGTDDEIHEDERVSWLESVANNVYWAQFWASPENRQDAPEQPPAAEGYLAGQAGEAPADAVEAATFETTEEAEKGAERVAGLILETLSQTVSALPGEVVTALDRQDLENMAVEANKP